ncbi:MAG: hypothetical protein J1E42_08505 [Akkermansiaceae bacterium]|nr:hypothetical protein [Akkermansiaceae bacterium]
MVKNDSYHYFLSFAAGRPSLYKLCLVCFNILERDVEECSYCGGYRFELDSEAVTNAALDLATKQNPAVREPYALQND